MLDMNGAQRLKETTGQALKQARLNMGMKQNEAARLVGYSRSMMSQIESGRNTLPLFALINLCKLYKIEIGSIFAKINICPLCKGKGKVVF